MPRQWTETVSDWPEIKQNQAHAMRVVRIEKIKKPPGFKATLEHTEREQFGRQHTAALPLPCRPGGPAAGFFRACGQRVEAGAQIQPKECIGQSILVRFGLTQAGVLEPTSFEPIRQEAINGSQSTTTIPSPAPRTEQLLHYSTSRLIAASFEVGVRAHHRAVARREPRPPTQAIATHDREML